MLCQDIISGITCQGFGPTGIGSQGSRGKGGKNMPPSPFLWHLRSVLSSVFGKETFTDKDAIFKTWQNKESKSFRSPMSKEGDAKMAPFNDFYLNNLSSKTVQLLISEDLGQNRQSLQRRAEYTLTPGQTKKQVTSTARKIYVLGAFFENGQYKFAYWNGGFFAGSAVNFTEEHLNDDAEPWLTASNFEAAIQARHALLSKETSHSEVLGAHATQLGAMAHNLQHAASHASSTPPTINMREFTQKASAKTKEGPLARSGRAKKGVPVHVETISSFSSHASGTGQHRFNPPQRSYSHLSSNSFQPAPPTPQPGSHSFPTPLAPPQRGISPTPPPPPQRNLDNTIGPPQTQQQILPMPVNVEVWSAHANGFVPAEPTGIAQAWTQDTHAGRMVPPGSIQFTLKLPDGAKVNKWVAMDEMATQIRY
eukprot:TRINITY_DN19771_c0_g1_i1.p1 TRINITY_DN19771_c0_g1~~TRINITY_DN19771_c0_g1_i1.p1  ORF type:complete len:423 (+),score=69.45 TRINITY_DN19771_c0_g1_i1:66-1334(+)